jgi:hypothetical protein
VKVDIDFWRGSRSMTETDSCGSLSRAQPRTPNPVRIQLDEEAAEFEERTTLLEGRFECSFHLFIEELTKVSIVLQSTIDKQCGQLILSAESVRSRHDSTGLSMDSVQKRNVSSSFLQTCTSNSNRERRVVSGTFRSHCISFCSAASG